MILLHGIARHAHTFDHLAPHFARNFHVLAIDMRGHGDSDWDPEGALPGRGSRQGSRGPGGAAAAAAHHVDRQLDRRPRGAGVRRAASEPGREADRRGCRPRASRRHRQRLRTARQAGSRGTAGRREDELVAQTDNGEPGRRGGMDPQLRAFRRQAARRRPPCSGSAIPHLVRGFLPTELWRYVSRITSPTIYILGGQSTIVPAETQRRLKEMLPRCEIVVMPGLGHYPDVESPAEFLAIVDRFLQS